MDTSKAAVEMFLDMFKYCALAAAFNMSNFELSWPLAWHEHSLPYRRVYRKLPASWFTGTQKKHASSDSTTPLGRVKLVMQKRPFGASAGNPVESHDLVVEI